MFLIQKSSAKRIRQALSCFSLQSVLACAEHARCIDFTSPETSVP